MGWWGRWGGGVGVGWWGRWGGGVGGVVEGSTVEVDPL